MGSLTEELAIAQQQARDGNLGAAEQRRNTLIQRLRSQPLDSNLAEQAAVWLGVGVLSQQMGQLSEAIAAYQAAIALQPQLARAYNNLGTAFKAQGELEQAEQAYREALVQQPHYPEVYLNLGNLARQRSHLGQAIAHYKQALEQQPHYADAWHNLGWIAQQQGQSAQAMVCYQRALEADPSNPDLLNAVGNGLQRLGKFAQAISYYQRAIARRPEDPAFYSNLGAAHQELGQFDQSLIYYQKAIALNPTYADAYYNLGNHYKAQDALLASRAAFQRAIALQPNYPQALNNLGLVEYELGNLRDSIQTYGRAIALRPNYPDAHLNRGLALLQGGDLRAGFADYEWRWQVVGVNFKPPRTFTQPQWDGSELAGQTILLHAEQGFGDTLQFIRYVPAVVARGGRVVVEAQAALKTLLATMPGIDQVIARGEDLPEFQVHAPLMSLPHILQTTLATIPNTVPYLPVPDPEPMLPGWDGTALRVGLVWSGSTGNLNDRLRSCQLSLLRSLLDLPGIQVYSLQKEVRSEDEALFQELVAQGSLGDLAPLMEDFLATAALIQQLDVVITVDTAVAHLTGALGKPVWIMLTHAPDWRWLQYRQDSPWYPQARLFRQTHRQDWQPVIDRLRLLLETIERSHHQRPLLQDRGHQAVNWMKQANALRMTNGEQAIRCYHQALSLNPQDYRIHNNLGVALRHQGQLSGAIAAYHCALMLHPGFADAHYNLGNAWREQGDLPASIYHYQRALALQPSAAAWNNLGNSLKDWGAVEPAIAAYEQAIALEPDHASAHHNRGYVRLLQGDLAAGFADYEWRWRVANFKAMPEFGVPQWDGSPLDGKTILLHTEQGFGDAIQFCRYVPQVAALGGRVVVQCRAPLVRLLATVAGVAQVVERDRPLPPIDVHAPLMSLPHLLQTTLDTIPAQVPYLQAPPSHLRLKTSDRPAVGLVWGGSPTHLNDAQRSLPVHHLRDLLDYPLQLYSLQKGSRARHVTDLGDTVVDLSNRLQDFADTAAAIAQLDVLITVDTAVAHLAGALGKPVWVLLSYAPDWRWMLARSDSPWYPSLRLFRQATAGDWAGVMGEVVRALEVDLGITRQRQPVRSPLPAVTPSPRRSPSPTIPTPDSKTDSKTNPVTRPAIGIGWQLNPATGWGIYGTNLALQLLPTHRPVPLVSPAPTSTTPFNPLHWALLQPALEQTAAIARTLQASSQPYSFPGLVLRGLGNQCRTAPELERLSGHSTVGVIFFEDPQFTTAALQRAKTYDWIITGSTWNEQVLRAHGIERVSTVFQGIDPGLFHPAPRNRLLGDRFVIFSGGKLEYRKGQDLVIRAFKHFRDRHPEALLLTAWHNAWPATMAGLDTAGHVTGIPPLDATGRLQIQAWLAEQGIPADAVVDVGVIPNHLVAPIIREADVALFPNRAEGGTNLAAMESLACGLPTILSANTGHLDLLGDAHCYPLRHQGSVRPTPLNTCVEGWGESDLEEILAYLEQIHGDRPGAQARGQAAAQVMQDWTWERQVQRLLQHLQPFMHPSSG